VRSAPDPLLQLTHGLTLEAYVYLRNSHGGVVLMRGDRRHDYDPYYLLVNTAGVLHPLPLQQWMHVAGTLDDASGSMGLYINGNLVASNVIDFRARGRLTGEHAGLSIGADIKDAPGSEAYFFHGSIDDVRICDVALDPSQFLPPP
jgi:hypothetical protein